MWSFTQNKMVSTLEEALEDPERVKNRRKCIFWKMLYYSCCFLKDPYINKDNDEWVTILQNNE
jgi:hypothetical protein